MRASVRRDTSWLTHRILEHISAGALGRRQPVTPPYNELEAASCYPRDRRLKLVRVDPETHGTDHLAVGVDDRQ